MSLFSNKRFESLDDLLGEQNRGSVRCREAAAHALPRMVGAAEQSAKAAFEMPAETMGRYALSKCSALWTGAGFLQLQS
jgi:hypothetical protein